MDLGGLEIEVVVVQFPLIGLALGFLAPSGAKAKARSNLATELPVLRFFSVRSSYGKGNKKSPSNSFFWITMLIV